MTNLASLLAGLLFGVGLTIARMTDPDVVLAFLDITGAWNPALLFVMAGAAGTFGLFYFTTLRRARPILLPRFTLPTAEGIDRRLLAGTAVFGLGWGLAGVCPGPAVTSLASGSPSVLVFVVTMVAGIKLAEAVVPSHATSRKAGDPAPQVRDGSARSG